MTKHECAIVTAYTGFSMLKGSDLKYLYNYLSGFIGRPVYSHEIPAVAEIQPQEPARFSQLYGIGGRGLRAPV